MAIIRILKWMSFACDDNAIFSTDKIPRLDHCGCHNWTSDPRKGMPPITLTHSVFFVPQVAHKASTRERHCCRFAACLVMVSQVSVHDFISFSMVLRQVSLGRPLFRFPSGVQRRAILGSASVGIRHTCPSHLHLNSLLDNLGKRFCICPLVFRMHCMCS